MRPLRHLLVLLTAVAVCLAASPPATAASLSWNDDPGDATGFDPLPPPASGVVGSTPRPSEESLDLLAVTAASDGQAVIFTARTAVDAVPPGATGTTLRFVFTYDGASYQLIGQRTAADFSAAITSGLFFRAREPRSPELACRECTIRYDQKTATVTVRALLSSLSGGIREHSPESKKLAPGATFSDLSVLAQRNLVPAARDVDVGRTVTVDVAAAGDATLSL